MPNIIKKIVSSWPAAIILAVFFSVIAVILFGYSSYDVDGFQLGINIAPSVNGQTELVIPPVGEITASTHKVPVKLQIRFERIYPHEITKVANAINGRDDLVEKIETESTKAFKKFVFRILILAFIGGAIGGLILPKKRILKTLIGAFIGVICVGIVIYLTYNSYNIDAFKQPKYTGVLSAAPWATEEIAKRIADVKAFKQEIREVVKNVNIFYSKINSWQPIGDNTINILHVSDIHNNPIAIDITKRMVKDFNIDFVIDTGDITDFGTPIENKLLDGIQNLNVPYIYIAGNHDSSSTVTFMKGISNVNVLDGFIKFKNISIFGVPDPNSKQQSMATLNNQELRLFRNKIQFDFKRLNDKPLIAAVHNPEAAECLFRKVPVVLTGHTHKASIKEQDGYVLVNAGTTGAAGLRTFKQKQGVPYTLNILRIDAKQKRLIAIDTLEFTGFENEFKLERNLIEGSLPLENEIRKERKFGSEYQTSEINASKANNKKTANN